MKIDKIFIDNIFNLKIKLKNNNDKSKLSKYEDYIPMYDIYSQRIYPIYKLDLHYRLINYHFRFINADIKDWLETLYNKYRLENYKTNLEILKNYTINILIETSYKTLYKYSPSLGLLVSMCKRNSFNPYTYLEPYYTKLELIKLGQNMNLIGTDIDTTLLLNIDVHFNICKKVSNNDISFSEIQSHHEFIIDNNLISWMCFYSFFGSFLFNKYLRSLEIENDNNKIFFHPIFINGLYKIIEGIKKSPILDNDYDMYRFIWDDSILINLAEGDVFMDKGFLSTTRDPFYSPGISGNFGLILIKIKIPKNKLGIGVFIENFSLFPKEEEFLIQPYYKFKLISKNEKFKYYHINDEFEKIIHRKYELELIGCDIKSLNLLSDYLLKINKSIINNKTTDITLISINGIDKIDIIKNFIFAYSNNNKIDLTYKGKFYSFCYLWFDSTNESSYENLYYNKVKDGMMFSLFDDSGYPYLNIELGKTMVINYLNKLYYSNQKYEITEDLLGIIYNFGRIFNYTKVIIYHNYTSFFQFKDNYSNNTKMFLSFNLFNFSLYNYLKFKIKFLDFDPFITYKIGYWYLDDYFNKPIDDNIINKIPDDLKIYKTNRELFINIIEKYFYLYFKIIESLDNNIFNNTYVVFNIYEKLLSENLIDNFKPDFEYTLDKFDDDNYKLIFRQPVRRSITNRI